MTLLLGLGIIGIRCADQITAAGKKLTTWNRTPKDRSDSTTDLVASASEAEVISCYLRDDLAVREIFRPNQRQPARRSDIYQSRHDRS